jgi:two-component system nitrate/nitrite response regulator NarL
MRLVVADNDRDYLELLKLELSLEHHDVVAAVLDGDTAVAACATLQPDAFLVDFRMPPGPDGLRTIEAVRSVAPDVVCLLHSNYRSEDMQQRARRLGVRLVPKSTLKALREALADIVPAPREAEG